MVLIYAYYEKASVLKGAKRKEPKKQKRAQKCKMSSSGDSSVGSGLILNETLNAAINALSADSDDENENIKNSASSVKSVRKDIDFSDVVYYFIDQLPTGVQTAVDDIIK